MAQIFKEPENPVQPEQAEFAGSTAKEAAEKSVPNPEPPKNETPEPSIYDSLATPPQNALKPMTVGALKGKSEINPQWRIEAMTKKFGPCGIGWKYEIVEAQERSLADGQILLFMRVDLRYKLGMSWSDPIPGYGGDFIVEKNKNGLVPNDEAYKMCLTDALGNAMKCIGVAADVYRGLYDTKYNRHTDAPQQTQKPQQPSQHVQQPAPQQAPQQAPQPQPEPEPWARFVNGRPQVRGKKGWQELTALGPVELQAVMNSPHYALVHQAANNLLMTGTL